MEDVRFRGLSDTSVAGDRAGANPASGAAAANAGKFDNVAHAAAREEDDEFDANRMTGAGAGGEGGRGSSSSSAHARGARAGSDDGVLAGGGVSFVSSAGSLRYSSSREGSASGTGVGVGGSGDGGSGSVAGGGGGGGHGVRSSSSASSGSKEELDGVVYDPNEEESDAAAAGGDMRPSSVLLQLPAAAAAAVGSDAPDAPAAGAAAASAASVSSNKPVMYESGSLTASSMSLARRPPPLLQPQGSVGGFASGPAASAGPASAGLADAAAAAATAASPPPPLASPARMKSRSQQQQQQQSQQQLQQKEAFAIPLTRAEKMQAHQSRSLCYFTPENSFRRALIRLFHSLWWDRFVTIVAVLNIVALGNASVEETRYMAREQNRYFWFELAFSIVYTLEFVLKCVAFGFVQAGNTQK